MTEREYNQCVDQYADGVYRFILKNMQVPEDAQDVVQSAFEKMWKNHQDVKIETAKAYLFTVAYNQMIDHIRKNKRMTLVDEFSESFDQTNFETWFFMYADNELSADERWEVEEFVRKNPSCQKEFDSIQRLQFHPEQVAFPDKSVLLADQMSLNDLRFEADTSIVYPFKQELYRQMSLGKKRSYYSMAIAASMLLLVGLFFLFNQQEQIPTSLPVTKNIVQGSLAAPQNSLASNTVPSKSEKLTNIVSSRRTKKIQLAVAEELVLQVEEPVIVPEMESKSEETVVIASTPSSNLSEEALRAAAYRMASPAPTQPDAVSINTAMIIEASAKSTEQGRLRGLVRKLSRQLFKEKETDDQKKYIQVASFAIPVSNKK